MEMQLQTDDFLDVGPTLKNSFSPNVLFIHGIVFN